MIRGAAETAKQEDELEEAIVLEILQQGRGERQERGEREEWNQHIGWHRTEDMGLRPHPRTKDHTRNIHRNRGMEQNVAGEKYSDHSTDTKQEDYYVRNQLLRKRKHDHTTDLRENFVLNSHADENSNFGFLGLVQLGILIVLLAGFVVWWNKRRVGRILGRRRIRGTRSTKGRTL